MRSPPDDRTPVPCGRVGETDPIDRTRALVARDRERADRTPRINGKKLASMNPTSRESVPSRVPRRATAESSPQRTTRIASHFPPGSRAIIHSFIHSFSRALRTARGCFFGANDDVRRAARHRRAVLASGRRHRRRRRRRGSAAERHHHHSSSRYRVTNARVWISIHRLGGCIHPECMP